jgi:hypothetical protein
MALAGGRMNESVSALRGYVMTPEEFAQRFERCCQYGDALLWPVLLASWVLASRTTGLFPGMLLVAALLWAKRRVDRVMNANATGRAYRYTTWKVLKFFLWAFLAAMVLVIKTRMDTL